MTNTLLRAGGLACALMTCTALTAPAMAQSAPPPRFNQVDGNGVDLVTGDFFVSMTEGSIGSGEGELALERHWAGPAGWTDNWSGTAYQRGSEFVVEFGSYSDTFTVSGGTYTSTKANGATLVSIAEGQLYTAADGTQITFKVRPPTTFSLFTGPACQRADSGKCSIPVSIQRPNGMTHTLTWDQVERCFEHVGQACTSGGVYVRLRTVSNSANYSFTLNYATDTPGSGAPVADWYARADAQFTNLDGAPSSLPTVTYSAVSSTVADVTDIGGRTWRFTLDTNGRLTGIRRPGASADTATISYSGAVVTSVANEGVTTNYARSVSGTTATTTVTAVDGDSGTTDPQTVVVSDLATGRPTSITDPLSRQTSYQYDSSGRLTRVTRPEGNYVEYTYDARGNVTETRTVAKSGTGLADIVATASYDSSCSNPVTCNLPNSVTDARGNTTDLEYDSTHGGVTRATPPAASVSATTRPQTRYSYSQITAVTGQPVYLLTAVSACQSQAGASGGTPAACVDDDDEVRTVTAYDTDNLRVTSVTQRAGDNSVSATHAFAYDAVGNLLTVDGPLSGSDDTTRFRYNAARQLVGTIGPDPDSTDPLKHRARRTTYTNGLATKVETGTVNSQSDSDWAAFASLEEVQQEYDANARPTVSRLVSGSTTHALTQTGYDGLGRVRCVAQRMNPSEFASLPSDACTLDTEGSHGPDRISRTSYDLAGQVIKVETAVGVSGVAADEVSTTYRSNGQAETVTDAEGNRTTYVYDGHDRLSRTRMPDPSTDNVSSTTDYEELTYDAGSNVTNLRRRDNSNIGFAYDALNRLASKDLPGSEPTVSYTYDLLGRMLSAGVSSQTVSFTFDALGRNLTQAGPLGTASYAYDVAGRRSRLTYPGSGLYVDYEYLVTGEVRAIRENGASSGAGVLAIYSYDDRGRRTQILRGNNTITSYTYDDVSRLASLNHNLDGPTDDLTLGFGYSPASQIVQNTRDNNGYSFTGHANANIAASHNGLNQVTAVGDTSISHGDARGNVTAIGSAGYGYSAENMLVSGPGSVSLTYDPLNRLYQVESSTTTRFAYDGASLIAEYDGSNALQRRFVHGPGVDEPLVWYEGTGTSTRRWFHQDERGSVVAISDAGADLYSTANRYDEYGNVQGTLTGRFGYTGQMWLPEIGLNYYRARMYNPSLGRFMQTDPIGYGGGMNLYAYVLNDPVNFSDPLGLGRCEEDPDADATVCADDGKDTGSGGGTAGEWGFGSILYGGGNGSIADWIQEIIQNIVEGEQNVVVTATRPKSASKGPPHRYSLLYPTICSARDAFNRLLEPGMSAPGAPRARMGFTPRIMLSLGNPISQRVDPVSMTIINTTLPGHAFYPGDVIISVITRQNNTSDIQMTGTGRGKDWLLNNILGVGFFGFNANSIASGCLGQIGIVP